MKKKYILPGEIQTAITSFCILDIRSPKNIMSLCPETGNEHPVFVVLAHALFVILVVDKIRKVKLSRLRSLQIPIISSSDHFRFRSFPVPITSCYDHFRFRPFPVPTTSGTDHFRLRSFPVQITSGSDKFRSLPVPITSRSDLRLRSFPVLISSGFDHFRFRPFPVPTTSCSGSDQFRDRSLLLR